MLLQTEGEIVVRLTFSGNQGVFLPISICMIKNAMAVPKGILKMGTGMGRALGIERKSIRMPNPLDPVISIICPIERGLLVSSSSLSKIFNFVESLVVLLFVMIFYFFIFGLSLLLKNVAVIVSIL